MTFKKKKNFKNQLNLFVNDIDDTNTVRHPVSIYRNQIIIFTY